MLLKFSKQSVFDRVDILTSYIAAKGDLDADVARKMPVVIEDNELLDQFLDDAVAWLTGECRGIVRTSGNTAENGCIGLDIHGSIIADAETLHRAVASCLAYKILSRWLDMFGMVSLHWLDNAVDTSLSMIKSHTAGYPATRRFCSSM